MNETFFETFDALFRTARKQSLHIESLETRVCELERELRELREAIPMLTLVDSPSPETATGRAG